MDYLVEDISTLDENTKFRNDVQLSDFRSDKNMDLLKSYMFTAGNFEDDRKSSFGLLNTLYHSIADRSDNRFLIQATYGHGKSHLGLALANFFGKAADSNEFNILIKKLAHTAKDAATVGGFKSFKTNKKPFLVVVLRGDVPGNLRDKFFRSLDEALKDNDETKELRPPLWFDAAIEYLDKLNSSQVQTANDFLKPDRLNCQGLRQRLENKESELYDLCVKLCRTVSNVNPDFGGETSLSDAISWAVKDLCGDDKPFGGILILFDEFSVFVSEYKKRQATGVHLQELMNGVSSHQGKVLFVAFSQHAPENLAKNDGSPEAQDFLKELNRIPKRHRLHSSLEDVFGAYFRINKLNWENLLKSSKAGMQVPDASDVAYEALKVRYQNILQWSSETFQERVTKECFPLHPLTTALLSSVDFEAATTTRSVLKFLTDPEGVVKLRLKEPVIFEGKVNWILPISLVGYFKEMLGEQVWWQYEAVKIPDLTDKQAAVLKGMVLQIAGNLPTKQIGFEKLIGQLTGLTASEAKEVLASLEKQRYIRFDSSNKAYSFWSGSNEAIELEQLLNKHIIDLEKQKKLDGYLDSLDTDSSNIVNKILSDTQLLQSHPVKIPWGSPDDWVAQEFIVTKVIFNYRNLEKLLSTCMVSLKTYPSHRGIILMLIAENEEEVSWYSENVQRVLNTSANLKSAPLLVLRPHNPMPEFKKLLIKNALMDKHDNFRKNVTNKINKQVFEEEKTRFEEQIKSMLNQLRLSSLIEVSQEAKGAVNALSLNQGSVNRIPKTLQEVYRVVYHSAPSSWFTQYKHSSGHNMRNAVSDLVTILTSNNLTNARAGLSKLASEIVDKFIEGDWEMLSKQDQLQEPTSIKIKDAWKKLDKEFIAGESTPISAALEPLLNAPFGYDYNTLTILFCSWVGFNHSNLDIVINGSFLVINDDFMRKGKSNLKPNDFLSALSEAQVYRKDTSKLIDKVEEAVKAVEKGDLSKEEAETKLSILDKFKINNSDSNLAKQVEMVYEKLEENLKALNIYENSVKQIQTTLLKAKSITTLSGVLKKVQELQEPLIITSKVFDRATLHKQVTKSVSSITQAQCEQYENISILTDYGKYEERLRKMYVELNKLNFKPLTERVSEALKNLKQSKIRLENEQSKKPHLDIINQISTSVGLAELVDKQKVLNQYIDNSIEEVKLKASKKLEKIQKQIKELSDFAIALPKKLDEVQDLGAAKALREEIVRKKDKYENTPNEKDIEEAYQYGQNLEKFFISVKQYQELGSYSQVLDRIKKLDELLSTSSNDLSQTHTEVVNKVIQKLEKHLLEQEANAQEQLDKINNQLDSVSSAEDISALQIKLQDVQSSKIPSVANKVDELNQKIEAKIDENEVRRIEWQFRKIKDPQKRLECFKRLEEVLKELSSVR